MKTFPQFNSLRRCALLVLSVCVTSISANWNEGGGEQGEALALTPNIEHGREVYDVCSACHMPEGWGLPDGSYPELAGQHGTVVIKQLADIRARNRDNPSMYPFALPAEIGGPQAIADVAAYIETLPMTHDNGTGPGTNLKIGKQLYQEHCVECHGVNGEGDAERFYPRIHGQHYRYLLRQIEWIRDGKRRNANEGMVEKIKGFSQEDLEAVTDYVSRIRPPAELLAKP